MVGTNDLPDFVCGQSTYVGALSSCCTYDQAPLRQELGFSVLFLKVSLGGIMRLQRSVGLLVVEGFCEGRSFGFGGCETIDE